jgi:hypothetical protein
MTIVYDMDTFSDILMWELEKTVKGTLFCQLCCLVSQNQNNVITYLKIRRVMPSNVCVLQE